MGACASQARCLPREPLGALGVLRLCPEGPVRPLVLGSCAQAHCLPTFCNHLLWSVVQVRISWLVRQLSCGVSEVQKVKMDGSPGRTLMEVLEATAGPS